MTTTTIHPSAIVHSFARIGNNVVVSAHAVISEFASIGDRTHIGPSSYVGENVRLGTDCNVGPGVTIENCHVGDRVVFKPGCRVGQDGFGFVPTTNAHSTPQKKPQTKGVVLGNDVELGANTVVDRGSWRNTQIGSGTKLDNLVHVGHNVIIGENCLLAAQTGIAGSVELGNRVLVGGQCGFSQYVKIGDDVHIAAKSGVTSDVSRGRKVGGYPAVPIAQFHRSFLLSQPRGTRDPRSAQ